MREIAMPNISIFWLKAFGNQAITVPGEKSREIYHPIAHPHKFDGVLPVLWHDEDDTIFAVPQRSPSLAHVVPRGRAPASRSTASISTPCAPTSPPSTTRAFPSPT